jgi:hypothetical protein
VVGGGVGGGRVIKREREMFGSYRYQMRAAEVIKELNVFILLRKKGTKRNCFSADK